VVSAGVLPRRLVLRSALTGAELTSLELGELFAEWYGAPYVVLHRSDLLEVLHDACVAAGVSLRPGVTVTSANPVSEIAAAPVPASDAAPATVTCETGEAYSGDAVIAADSLTSVLRGLVSSDEPVDSGLVAYRGTASASDVPGVAPGDVTAWIGPDLHFVQYVLRGGEICNHVAVFRARHDGGPDELDEAFGACCGYVREAMRFLWRDRCWPMRDRFLPPPGWPGGSRCSATPRTRCCSISRRAPVRRSRTPPCWRTRSARTPWTRCSPSTSGCALRGRPGSSAPPARGATSGMSTVSVPCFVTSSSASASRTTTRTPTGSTSRFRSGD
jgi:hypothetical protein